MADTPILKGWTPAWDNSTPVSEWYVNPADGNDVFQIQGASGEPGHTGEWHVYRDRAPVWVAGYDGNNYEKYTTLTGGTPPAPVPTPAPPAPAPPAPAPPAPPTPTPTPTPTGPSSGQIYQEIQTQIQEINKRIETLPNSGVNPQQSEQILASLQNLHGEIAGLQAKGELEASQANSLDEQVSLEDNQTYSAEIGNINKKVSEIQVSGSISEQDQKNLTDDIKSLQGNISNNSIVSPEQKYSIESQLTNLQQEVNTIPVATNGNGGTPAPPTIIGGGTTVTSPGNSGSGSSGSGDSQPATPASGQYTVQPGDSMWSIAEANGMTLQQIEALNPQISNPRLIFPGEQVNVAGGGAVTDSSTVSTTSSPSSMYTVQSGDNMWDIAKAHGMSLQQLEALNPGVSDPSMIHPNQQINVGGGDSPAAPAASDQTNATQSSYVFPQSSSYQSSGATQAAPAENTSAMHQAGWTGNETSQTNSDPTQALIESATKTNTDPLKIPQNKSNVI